MTGWRHDLLQDICRDLSRWFESRPGAIYLVRNPMNQRERALMVEVPWMKCENRLEFQQRLQWLSEGMLRNHMEHVVHYSIDQAEIATYKKFKESK